MQKDTNINTCRAMATADDMSSALTKALSFHFKTKKRVRTKGICILDLSKNVISNIGNVSLALHNVFQKLLQLCVF